MIKKLLSKIQSRKDKIQNLRDKIDKEHSRFADLGVADFSVNLSVACPEMDIDDLIFIEEKL